MKKLTVAEILQIIEDNDISVSSFAHGDFEVPDDFELSGEAKIFAEQEEAKLKAFEEHPEYEFRWDDEKTSPEFKTLMESYKNSKSIWEIKEEEYLNSIGVGPFEEVEQKGGMDEGSYWNSIKYFSWHDVYICTEGFYQSHHGTEFDDGYGYQVFPKEKTITVYEP